MLDRSLVHLFTDRRDCLYHPINENEARSIHRPYVERPIDLYDLFDAVTKRTSLARRSSWIHRNILAGRTHYYWYIFDTEKVKDRKSTRLNSSHVSISYAVFFLKKKTMP